MQNKLLHTFSHSTLPTDEQTQPLKHQVQEPGGMSIQFKHFTSWLTPHFNPNPIPYRC